MYVARLLWSEEARDAEGQEGRQQGNDRGRARGRERERETETETETQRERERERGRERERERAWRPGGARPYVTVMKYDRDEALDE